jgi:hypothetical protein
MNNSDLKTKLTAIEHGDDGDLGDHVTSWHKNPDGSAALAEIERLEARVAELEIALETSLDDWIARAKAAEAKLRALTPLPPAPPGGPVAAFRLRIEDTLDARIDEIERDLLAKTECANALALEGARLEARVVELEGELSEAMSEAASRDDSITLVREVLDAAGVPTAGFVDDHVRNLVVMLKEERQRRAGGEPATIIVMQRELRDALSRIAQIERDLLAKTECANALALEAASKDAIIAGIEARIAELEGPPSDAYAFAVALHIHGHAHGIVDRYSVRAALFAAQQSRARSKE